MGNDFKDKIIIITGALGALGSGLCSRFADEGAKVFACARGDASRLDAWLKNLPRQGDGEIFPCAVDITDEQAVTSTVDEILKTTGRVDILINNAAVTETAPFMALSPDRWDDIIDTNLSGAKRMCAAVARPMMAKRKGCIINISSVLSAALGRGSAAYAASKAALNRFTEVAAIELGKFNVRVNGISPGLLSTGMGRGMASKIEEIALSRTPLGRKGEIKEVVDAAVFLASPFASFITGHILAVDGGLSIG